MPRKKLRKQRISIRRESILLSEAGPPFLGFISDGSASAPSPPWSVSILGLVLCLCVFVSHTVGGARGGRPPALCRSDVTEAEEGRETPRGRGRGRRRLV